MRLRLDLIFTEKVCKVAALAWAEMLQNNGGDLLRDKIKNDMQAEHGGEAPLKTVEFDCNGCLVKGLIFSNLKTYAPIRDLASCYGLATDWNPDKRRVVLYGDTMPNPRYLYSDLGLSNTPVVDVCYKLAASSCQHSCEMEWLTSGFLSSPMRSVFHC